MTFIDLFCGCGGFTLGMMRAGFRCLAAIDLDPEAVKTLRKNLGELRHPDFPPVSLALERDLTRFPPEELARLIGTENLDVFDGAIAAALKHRFRLLDDDGEVYYKGLSEDCNSQNAFAPRDDFGQGYAGCTEIHDFTAGAWRQI